MEQKKFEFNEMSFDGEMDVSKKSVIYGDNKDFEMSPSSMVCPSVQECPQERVCHRYICYDVPHIIPCNTKIINHHIYRHTYTPCFTCSEENVCENIYSPKCCF